MTQEHRQGALLADPLGDVRKDLVGTVTPPPDMLDAARKSLSDAGYNRLIERTGGRAPTPAELCREVEFERSGQYPDELPNAQKLQRIAREAALLAVARAELSEEAFKELLLKQGQRELSAADLCAAVDAERMRQKH